MKLGIMGASFDPPHRAHLAIASAAFDGLRLDRLVFVPAFCAPLKPGPHTAGFEHRARMLKIALKNFSKPFEVSEIEKDRGGESYSVDTAEAIASENPGAELFWIIGTDQLCQLHKWRDIARLAALTSFAVFDRPGYPFEVPSGLPAGIRLIRIPLDPMDVSSSNIRESLKNGQKRLDLTDPGVLDYIRNNNLYTHG